MVSRFYLLAVPILQSIRLEQCLQGHSQVSPRFSEKEDRVDRLKPEV